MSSEIIYGLDLTNLIAQEIEKDNVFVVTDDTVMSLYGSLIGNARHYVIKAGEDSKTLANLERISLKMLESGCNRKTTVIALGGGVVGDLTGFVSASYMRGTKWINIPTTLLSQVDSSVGGKVAVDLGDYKNVIGAFHLPEKVIISTYFLSTLPAREWICGMGEIVKTAFLSKKVHDLVVPNLQKLLSRDGKVTFDCVCECIAYKEDIVSRDLYEGGLRKVLNLGHTVGHAIETVDKHRRSHGEYVLMGLAIEAELISEDLREITKDEIVNAVKSCGITVPDFDENEVAQVATKDKKNASSGISVMVARYEKTEEKILTYDQLKEGLRRWKSNR